MGQQWLAIGTEALAGAVLGGPFGVSPLGKLPLTHRAYKPQGLSQTTNREGAQPHPSVDNWIEVLLSTALPTRARLSFSHHQSFPSGSLHKPLSFLHQRADRRSKKNHNPTASKTKPCYRKLISLIKQKVMSQMKEQDKTSEKQLNEVEIGNFPEK